MLKNLKINIKLFIGFGSIVMVIIIAGFYAVLQLSEILDITRKTNEATEISRATLDLNIENFHTQLEVWGYINEPTQARLEAFRGRNETLNTLAGRLIDITEEEEVHRIERMGNSAGIVEGGVKQVKNIISDLKSLENNWNLSLLPAVEKVQLAKEMGYDAVDSENYQEYTLTLAEARKRVVANEKLFDRLGFSIKINKFVNTQEQLVEELEKELRDLVVGFIPLLVFLVLFAGIFSLTIGLFISKSIAKPIEEFRKGVEIIGKGNLDHKVGYEGGGEIGQLARAFDKMTESIRQSRVDVVRKVKEQTKEIVLEQKRKEKAFKQLEKSKAALEKMNEFMVDRELKMSELKKEIPRRKRAKDKT